MVKPNGESEKNVVYPSELVVFPLNKQDSDYTLLPTVSAITERAFCNHRFIKNFYVNADPIYKSTKDGVTEEAREVDINAETFLGAKELRKLEFSTPVSLDEACCKECLSLTDLVNYDNINIGKSAFQGCTALCNWINGASFTNRAENSIGDYALPIWT